MMFWQFAAKEPAGIALTPPLPDDAGIQGSPLVSVCRFALVGSGPPVSTNPAQPAL
jgi:hypothetical protein